MSRKLRLYEHNVEVGNTGLVKIVLPVELYPLVGKEKVYDAWRAFSRSSFPNVVEQPKAYTCRPVCLRTCPQADLSSSPLAEVQKASATLGILGLALVARSLALGVWLLEFLARIALTRDCWTYTLAHLVLLLALDAQRRRCLIQ